MTLHDRLRRELRRQGAAVDVRGAGADVVMDAARRRNRRTRVVGTVVALALVIGVGGLALALRGGDTDQVATEPGPAAEIDPPPVAPDPGSDDPGAGDEPALAPTPAPGSDDDPAADPARDTDTDSGSVEPGGPPPSPVVADLIAHRRGFVARSADQLLWSSADGVSWARLDDPRPSADATITHMASYDGTLFVAGVQAAAAAAEPWLARSDDLTSWKAMAVPPPAGDGSDLTTATHAIYTLGVGPAGVFVAGEKLIHLDLERLVPADALAAGAWSLGDPTGDLDSIIVYDPATGEPVEEIDLRAAGVPQSSIDLLAGPDPEPFVALGSDSLKALETDLEPGTLLDSGVVHGDELLAAGHSDEFSGRILWSSTDGRSWAPVPVSVIHSERARTIGIVDDRVVVFSSEGPLLTVQYRDGDDWDEVRLDELFGAPTDDYVLVDASFAPTGVVAIAAAVGETGSTTLHLLVSADGEEWSVSDLGELAEDGDIGEVGGVAMTNVATNNAVVAVGYQSAAGPRTVAVPVSMG